MDFPIIIECENCKTIFPCKLKNPTDASGIVKNGRKLDTWTDDFPTYMEKEYKISADTLDTIETHLVFGYEKLPKPVWKPSSHPLFENKGTNYEVLAKKELDKREQAISVGYEKYLNWYVKGRDTEKSFVIINYHHEGINCKAVFAKKIESERDLNTEGLYLVYHSQVDLEYRVDGIYTRDQILIFLERLLNRWRYAANEVLLVVPFIGFNYKNSEDALYELWNWLEINIDVSKTRLITRKGTFNLFKNAQDNTGIPFDELVRLGLLEPLIEKMTQVDNEYFQKSHAKYYVGVYDNYVEVLSGSFNIHQGKSFDNVIFKKYDKETFKKRYLHMFEEFRYAENTEESVHYITFGATLEENNMANLQELFTDIN